MPPAIIIAQRVLAFALGRLGFAPARIAAELARRKWGGIVLWPIGRWGRRSWSLAMRAELAHAGAGEHASCRLVRTDGSRMKVY